MGPHEEWEAGPGGFLEGVALALTMGGSLKAPGRGGAGSRTWFGRAGWESGAQLSSASLGDSQGAGSTGRAQVGSPMAPWSGSGVTRSPSGEAATRVPVKRKVRWVQRGGSEAP